MILPAFMILKKMTMVCFGLLQVMDYFLLIKTVTLLLIIALMICKEKIYMVF